jgi:hypothetical protein
MRILSTLIMGATLLIAGMAGSADAQTPQDPQTVPPDPQSVPQADRPYEGLFAKNRVPTEQSLTFMATLGGGYDANILAGSTATPGALPVTPSPLLGSSQPSTFENGSASLSYVFGGHRLSFSATAGSSANYYTSFRAQPLMVSDFGTMTAGWNVTSRTAVTANLAAGYGPFYTLPGVPVVPVVPDNPGNVGQTDPANQTLGQTLALNGGSALFVEDHLNVTGTFALTHAVTRRLSVALNYSDAIVTSPSHAFDLSAQSYGGGFSYFLGQGLSANLSYAESTGHFGVGGQSPTTSRGLNGGLTFNRSLSITRRTTLSFSSGLSAYSNGAVRHGRAQYFLSMQAALARQLGRTWTANLAYNRGATFLETFLQPVFSDAVTAGLGGRLSRRVQVQSSMGAIDGTVGLVGSAANRFRTYFASSGLRVDASRIVSVGFNYAYYRYRFASGVQLPPGVGTQNDRQSAQVYVSLWAPLMSRGRRPNAAR